MQWKSSPYLWINSWLLEEVGITSESMTFMTGWLWIFTCFLFPTNQAFLISNRNSRANYPRKFITVQYNFWKGLLDSAFENDPSLSTVDQRKGMLEGPNNYAIEDTRSSTAPLTEVQRAWRERQQPSYQVPTIASLLQNSVLSLDLYLVGIPSKDPSNDLYGSRVNISNRNKEFGLDLPSEPNAAVEVTILPDGVCTCSASPLTGMDGGAIPRGQWKLSEDGTQLRFSMHVLGYSRTIQTKGSIERVFWSDQPDVTTQTSTEYTIPTGWVYGDIKVGISKSRPGTLDLKTGGYGVLRVEQAAGFLGAGSKLIPCGAFLAKVVRDLDLAVPSE